MWRAIYETETGRLRSIGSVWIDPLPPGLSFKEYESKPNVDGVMWDETALDWVPRPPKIFIDRWDDLLDDPDFAPGHSQIPPPFRKGLERAIQNIMGNERFRNAGESKEIGGPIE